MFAVACNTDPDPIISSSDEESLFLEFDYCEQDALPCYNPSNEFTMDGHTFSNSNTFEYKINNLNDAIINLGIAHDQEIVDCSFLNKDDNSSSLDEEVNIQIRYMGDQPLLDVFLGLMEGDIIPIDFYIKIKYDEKIAFADIDGMNANTVNDWGNTVVFSEKENVATIMKERDEDPTFTDAHTLHIYKGKIAFNLLLQDADMPEEDKYVMAAKGERDFYFYIRVRL
jgi:hypothetical protein